MRLQDRVALITGGGSGIGRAMARLFASEGAVVAAGDKNHESAHQTAALIVDAGGRAIGVAADVTQPADVAAMVDATLAAFGRIDILVNNAGLALGDTLLEIDEELWDRNIAINLKSTYLCSRAVLPGMVERRRGVILNIASVNGLLAVGEAAYSAAKAGMISLTTNLAIQHGERGIRVNCIAPGTIRTAIWNDRVRQNPGVFDELTPWYPLGRIGEPEDVAKAALFLCSDDASWITGAVLPVDGGLSCGAFGFYREFHKFI